MNKTRTIIMMMLLVFVCSIPVFSFAQLQTDKWEVGQSIVGDCPVITTPNGVVVQNCGWNEFIGFINRVILFLLYLATVLAILTFMFAGFRMMTAGGNEGQVKEAKDMFGKVVVGLVFAYGAWIIVYFILTAFGVNTVEWSLI